MINYKARYDIVVERLLPGGPQGKTRTYSRAVSLSHFLCKGDSYVSGMLSKKKKILKSPNGRYYIVRSFNGEPYGTNEDVSKFYSKHKWAELGFKKSNLNNPLILHSRRLTDEQKIARLKKSEEIRDALGKLDSKFGGISKESLGSQELADLRFLLKA